MPLGELHSASVAKSTHQTWHVRDYERLTHVTPSSSGKVPTVGDIKMVCENLRKRYPYISHTMILKKAKRNGLLDASKNVSTKAAIPDRTPAAKACAAAPVETVKPWSYLLLLFMTD